MSETPVEVPDIDIAEVSRLVREVPDKDLDALMQSDQRPVVLGEIFGRMATHFRPEKAANVEAVVHFKVLDRPGGGYDHYEIVLERGRCTLSERPLSQPAVTIKVKPVDFLKLVTNNASGPALFLRGRLKLDGDVMLASRMTGLFNIPGS
jgi:putative sterol carrier protein